MGLLRGGINEVIATTTFNAAPIGIHYREEKEYGPVSWEPHRRKYCPGRLGCRQSYP